MLAQQCAGCPLLLLTALHPTSLRPECGVCIAQCAVYLALAPKSCAVYKAYSAAMSAADDEPHAPVPMHIRNAPTKMMKSIGYGKGYVYNPGAGCESLPAAQLTRVGRDSPGARLPLRFGSKTLCLPLICPHLLACVSQTNAVVLRATCRRS